MDAPKTKKKNYTYTKIKRANDSENFIPPYNLDKLRGKIYEKFKNVKAWGKAIGLSRIIAYKRLEGKHPFTQDEIYASMQVLDIKPKDVALYFFTLNPGVERWWEISD